MLVRLLVAVSWRASIQERHAEVSEWDRYVRCFASVIALWVHNAFSQCRWYWWWWWYQPQQQCWWCNQRAENYNVTVCDHFVDIDLFGIIILLMIYFVCWQPFIENWKHIYFNNPIPTLSCSLDISHSCLQHWSLRFLTLATLIVCM